VKLDNRSDKGDSEAADAAAADDDDDDSDSSDSDVGDTCQICDKLVTSDASTIRCVSRCNGVFHQACVDQSPTSAAESYQCCQCTAGGYRHGYSWYFANHNPFTIYRITVVVAYANYEHFCK